MEILLIIVVVLAIFMLPRLIARRPERELQLPVHRSALTGRMRFAIVASLLWPALVALFLKPWNNHWLSFFYIAVGPVALIWAIYWVLSGFRKERK